MINYALADAAGISAGFVLFSALAFFPGYLLAHLFNIWDFRVRSSSFQLAASVCLSLSLGPVLSFFTGRFAWLFYVAATMGALWLLVRNRPRIDKTVRTAGLVGLGWSVFAAIWLMDWQFSSRVYFPIYAADYSTRAAFVHSLAAFGLPAQTPLFDPGHPVALHYHFLWLLQCALIHGLAPTFITARLALIAGDLWCGLGLMCVAALAMRILMKRRSWMVIALLAVTGLDIIPASLILLANRVHLLGFLPPSAEWWNEQVDGWVYSMLWEPHYVCALIACVTGFLLIWDCRRPVLAIVAALCFATAVGSGSFVALVFAVFLAAWMILNLRESGIFALAAVLAGIFSLPYFATLRGPAQNVGSASLLRLSVRPFLSAQMPVAIDLLALPLNYFLELGFFGACVWIGYRGKLARTEWMLMVMAATSMLLCTFVKSGATPNNDFGWRGFLVAQFALLILSAEYLEKIQPSRFLKLLLVLGVLGTTYDLLLTRFFPILSDMGQVPKLKWLAMDEKLGERTRANREAYAWLQQHSAGTATIAQNPDVAAVDAFSGLYGDRKIVAGDRTCTVGFGGDREECASIEKFLTKVFDGETDLAAACPELTAGFYIVKDADPVWTQPRSWVWTKEPVFANQYVRIFGCARSNH